MKISIDASRCTGHKRCFNLYPELFEEGEQGKGRVLVATVPAQEEINAQSAANACPSAAVSVED
jgi:ferredoxin